MKSKNKYIISFMSIVVILVSFFQNASAHSTSQSGIIKKGYIGENYNAFYVGGEDVGWSIDEDYHAGTYTVSYRFASSVPANYKQKFYDGASLWYGKALFYESSSNPTGTITTFYDSSSYTVAAFYDYIGNADSNGHLTSWKIKMNTAKTVTAVVVAHELGHVLGLNDLYTGQNINKLMYGYSSGTATGPTTWDIKGKEVICGQHTTHTWGYRFHGTSLGISKHSRYCTYCGGYAAGATESSLLLTRCVYVNGICRLCGEPQ